MTHEEDDSNILPIYELPLNPQYPIIRDFISLYESTTVYIFTQQNIKTIKKVHIKDDIMSLYPSILTFNFYRKNNEQLLFFIMVVKDIIFISDIDQLNTPELKTFLISFFSSLKETTFIPISEKDLELFKSFFTIDNFLLPNDLTGLFKENETQINHFEEHIKKTFRKFNLQPTFKSDNYYDQDNIFLYAYRVRLIYCINRYYYSNESTKFDYYNQNFPFNENFGLSDFFKIANIDAVSSFVINRDSFAPCLFQYFAYEENDLKLAKLLIKKVVEFYKNAKFPSIIPCYGFIRNKDPFKCILVYRYMKNKSIKFQLNNKNYFTPEIISAIIFRISSAILFFHTHNLIHRNVTIENIFFDSYNRVHLGCQLMLSQDINCEHSKKELNENDIKSFGLLLQKICQHIPSSLKSDIDELANKCINNKKIDANDLFATVLANNSYYKGDKLEKFNFLISNHYYFTLNTKNALKSLKISDILTIVNHKNSIKFDFNDLMDIQIFKLENRIFEDYIVNLFSKNLWKFAVFGFFRCITNFSSKHYLCICVEKQYFLINSYFLTGMKNFLKELTNLILIPISLEAKLEFERIAENLNKKNQESKLSFTFINEEEILQINKSIKTINNICELTLSLKKKINHNYPNVEFNQYIQQLINYKKFIQFDDFKLPLICYFMQRLFFESYYFKDTSFFDQFSRFKSFTKINNKKQISMKDFQILKLIGSGGSARVYLAIHEITLAFVALKIYDSNDEHFLHEKKFFEKYGKQKFIIEYYDSFSDKERSALIIDFKSNGSISEFFSKEKLYYKPKNLSEIDMILKIILNLLFALHNLHCNLNCIYQDLSLHNIMVDHNFNIFLTDFELSIPFNQSHINSFKKDLFQLGKIIYFLCEKKEVEPKEIFFRLSNKSLFVLNLILNQCLNNSFARYGSSLLFIYEIKLFGGLCQDNNREIFKRIFNENKYLLVEPELKDLNIPFQNYSSPENIKMFSIFYNNGEKIQFSSLLLEICFENGYIVKKNYKKAFYYFISSQIEADEVSIFYDKLKDFNKIQDILLKMKNKELFMKLGYVYMKGIEVKKDYLKAKSFFEESKKITDENVDNIEILNYHCKLGKIEEKKNKYDDAYKLYCKIFKILEKNTNISDNLISIFFYHISICLYKMGEKNDAFIYLMQSISKNPNNFKAIKFLYSNYFIKSNLILPENCNYFNNIILKGKSSEALGDVYFLNNDKNNSIRYYSYASKLGELTASFKLGLIFYNEEEFKDDFKSIYYFSKIINYEIESGLSKKRKKKLNAYKIFSNLIILKIKIQYGCIIIDNINQYKCFLIDFENEKICDASDQYFFQFGLKEIKRNFIISLFCFEMSSKMNNKESQYHLGLIYYEGKYMNKDIIKAIHYFTLAADLNHQKSQSILGMIYYEGEGIQQDLNKAIHYLKLSVEQNDSDSESQYNLGLIYYEGEGVERDINKAIHCFTLAANNNNREAQFNLGMIYSDNKFSQYDINKAIHYYKLASNQQLTLADYNLGLIYIQQNDVDKAISYFQLASKENYSEAHCQLGLLYYDELYIKKDISKAIYYFKLAADLKFHEALFFLGFIYFFDLNDVDNSILYYKEASSLDDPLASVNLAVIYIQNNNFSDAKIQLQKAIDKKNTVALYNLASIYFYIEKKIDEAFDLLLESALSDFSPALKLLCVLFVKKFKKINLQNIDNILKKYEIQNDELKNNIFNLIKDNYLEVANSYQNFYHNKYFIYDIFRQPQDLEKISSIYR